MNLCLFNGTKCLVISKSHLLLFRLHCGLNNLKTIIAFTKNLTFVAIEYDYVIFGRNRESREIVTDRTRSDFEQFKFIFLMLVESRSRSL